MPIYNLIEYSDNHAKVSTSLWQFHKNVSRDSIIDSKSFKLKA